MHQKNNLTTLSFVVLLGMMTVAWFIWEGTIYKKALESSADPADAKNQTLIVQKGSSGKQIGELLEKKQLIKKAKYFSRYVRDTAAEKNLLSGRFQIAPSMTIPEIVLILIDPKKAENIVLIPEGFNIKQIDERLAEQNLIQKGEFTQAVKNFDDWENFPFLKKEILAKRNHQLEGYLFPDTYFIDGGDFNAGQFIRTMLKTFEKKVEPTLDEIILVASMLEKEIRTEKDLPIVAGIIWKRERSGWFLNIDATLLYEKNDPATKTDLANDSQYNTYTRKGFPPGPIGNPGLKTILAAKNPEESPYWFYLTKPETGEVVYAKTNDEQNMNRQKYL